MTTREANLEDQGQASDPGAWLDLHGGVLYRYALGRVGRAELAEDLLQETLLAALRSHESFRGEASVRTWLFGIMRRLLANHFRSSNIAPRDAKAGPAHGPSFFDERGSWKEPVAPWPDPHHALESGELRATLDLCLEKLPDSLAPAFLLREADGLQPPVVAERLGLSAGNLRVRLHRARLLLRACVEQARLAPTSAGAVS